MHNNDKPKRRGDNPRLTRSRALALTFSAASLLALPWQSHAFSPGWSCDRGVRSAECEIRISPNLRLEAPAKAIKNTGDPNRIELRGNLVLVTPAVELPLVQARLVAVFDPAGQTPMELYGTARAPLEKLPLLSDANLETVPGMAVGLVQPETIHGLLGDDLPLNDGPALDGSRRESVDPYFLFHVDLGLSMAIDLGKDAKAGTSLSLEVPGSDSATFILDPLDPYFYVAKGRSIQFPDTSKRGLYDQYTVVTYEKHDKKGRLVATIHEHYNTRGRLVNKYRHNTKNGTLVEHRYDRAGKVTVTFFEPNGRGGYRQEGSDGKNGRYLSANEVEKGRKSRLRRNDADQDKDKDKDKDKKDDDSPLKAFGYSRHGWIQFEAKTAEGIPKESRRFSGQLFLQGSIPFGKFVTLDGDVVTYAGKRGFSQGGNGLLSMSLPGLPDFIDFSLELGNASAALQIVEDRQMTYFSGVLEPDTLFFDDILPVFPAAGAKASGYIDNGLGDAHVTIEGQMDVGADVLGDWIGVDLNSLQMTKAKAKIDTRRMIVAGMTKVQVHPSIDIGGEVYAEASVEWASPEQASLYIYGDMTVFGVGLKDVSLSISRRGILVNGAFLTPLSRIGLSGSITDRGPMLTGSAGVMFRLGGISAAMKAAANTLTAAQTEVNRLDGLIAAARKVVNSERERNGARLQSARNAVSVAQNHVNSINGKISAEYRMISKRKSEIASWNRWRKKAKWYQVADRAARYSYEAGWRNADIGRRYATIAGLKTALGGAKVALAVAQEALRTVEKIIATIPVDADPRVAGLIVASKTAWVALEAAKLPFKNVPVIKGAFEGQIKVKLDIRGISGKASAAFDGYTLLAGNVVFARKPKACITLPGFGNVCAKI